MKPGVETSTFPALRPPLRSTPNAVTVLCGFGEMPLRTCGLPDNGRGLCFAQPITKRRAEPQNYRTNQPLGAIRRLFFRRNPYLSYTIVRTVNPSYAMPVSIKSPEQIEKMRVAGRLAAEVLEVLVPHVKPGVTTEELDRIAHDHIVNVQKAIPANVGYKGFPKTLCTSVNNVICHGIPIAGQDPEGRRHRQHRRHRHQGRLARRHQPHVFRRRAAGAGQAPGRPSPTRR